MTNPYLEPDSPPPEEEYRDPEDHRSLGFVIVRFVFVTSVAIGSFTYLACWALS